MTEWSVEKSELAEKHIKKHSRDAQFQKALKQCIKTLSQAEDPKRFGDRKHGRYKNVYGYKLTNSLRLLYSVNYNDHKIQCIDIGDHKQVYGKD